MVAHLGLILELALTGLLAVTLVYCIMLERRLAQMRRGQEGLASTITELNTAIAHAGASMRALKSAAGSAAETLDERVSRARAMIDELSVVTASGERIAARIEAGAQTKSPVASDLPSGSVMQRLKAVR